MKLEREEVRRNKYARFRAEGNIHGEHIRSLLKRVEYSGVAMVPLSLELRISPQTTTFPQ